MIVISFEVQGRKKPVAIVGPTRDLASVTERERPPSIADVFLSNMDRFRNVKEFLFVEPGAIVRAPLRLFERNGFDVAAYVERIGTPAKHGPFDGIGWIDMKTVFFRTSLPARRVLARWKEWIEVHKKPDREALLLALSEIKDASFLHLPPEYCWIEASMRSFHPAAEPRIEHEAPAVPHPAVPVRAAVPKKDLGPRPPEVLWAGHLYDYSGYGKINREVLFRVANTLSVRIDAAQHESVSVDEYTRSRLDAFKGTLIGNRAPVLRFFGPDLEIGKGRHRIVWTMMETYKAHPDMVKKINEGFDELWTPTEWNRQVFVESGVKIPTRTVPLGVNPLIYRVQKRTKLPPCRLLSTSKAGLVGHPEGFVFLTLGLPSFRKGFDVIAEAMDRAFARKPDVHLVIALTHSLADWNLKVYREFARCRARVWTLEGRFDEHALARVYAGADCYVSASRGEGWNLPICEAAACRLPVICPDNTSHPEVVGGDAFVFRSEGTKTYPEGDWISDWYKGMPFSVLGEKSVRELADLMRFVRSGDSGVQTKAAALWKRMLSEWTWDRSAGRAASRLLEVQP